MKLKSQLPVLVFAILSLCVFNSCSTAKGANKGRNCDCPKFGSVPSQQQEIIYPAVAATELTYLD